MEQESSVQPQVPAQVEETQVQETQEEKEAARDRIAHQEYVQALRDLADWYEAHPEMPRVRSLSTSVLGWKDPDPLIALAHAVKALGRCEKEFNDYLIEVFRKFGPIRLSFYTSREGICKKRVVWDCPESLLEALGGRESVEKALEEGGQS